MKDQEFITEVDPTAIRREDADVSDIDTIPWKYAPGGHLLVDRTSLIVGPVGHKNPIRLPHPYNKVNQPFVGSCSKPGPGNAGCFSWNRCPFARWAERMRGAAKAPWNVILRLGAQTTVAPCYHNYVGVDRRGWPVHEGGGISKGWRIVDSKTTNPTKNAYFTTDPITGTRTRHVDIVEREVPDLGPMYAKLTKEDWSLKEADDPVEEMYDTGKEPWEAATGMGKREWGDRIQAGGAVRGYSHGEGRTGTEGYAQEIGGGEYPEEEYPEQEPTENQDYGSLGEDTPRPVRPRGRPKGSGMGKIGNKGVRKNAHGVRRARKSPGMGSEGPPSGQEKL